MVYLPNMHLFTIFSFFQHNLGNIFVYFSIARNVFIMFEGRGSKGFIPYVQYM